MASNSKRDFRNPCEFRNGTKGKLDLITREELKEALGVSGETLRNWELMGLQRFQTPMERARKVYYRPSDIYLFLSVR